jgi:hypothetical protein
MNLLTRPREIDRVGVVGNRANLLADHHKVPLFRPARARSSNGPGNRRGRAIHVVAPAWTAGVDPGQGDDLSLPSAIDS